MTLQKYTKQPVAGSPAQYADKELRKIELSLNSFFTSIEELTEMAAAIEKGSFVVTATGLTTTPQVTAQYARSGNIVVLYIPSISGVSNSTSFTLTGIPTGLIPPSSQGFQSVIGQDNGIIFSGHARVLNTGVIQFLKNISATGFTAAGLKGSDHINLSFIIN